MSHTLKEYVAFLREQGLLKDERLRPGDGERTVALFSCDSREELKDALFLCKGAHFKEEYLHKAVAAGAFAYVAERDMGADASMLLVTDIRRAMTVLADFHYDRPWRELALIGITGTKGKSSTTYYMKSILDAWMEDVGGPESGVISSIDTYDGVERFESHLTTPEPMDLQRHFRRAADAGLRQLTMEVSSQALKYGRVDGIRFTVGCFLNIGRDHISAIEHPDEEDYFQSKLLLFPLCGTACVNLDSARADEVLAAAQSAGRVLTFSERDPAADVYADQVEKEGNGIRFRVRTPGYTRVLRLTMPGLFNVENALAAVTVCHALGVPETAVARGLERARVPGRREVYTSEDGKLTVIVDYAHNRLSFERLFRSVAEEYPGAPVSIVFGCPGCKAQERRRDLPEVSSQYACRTYLTEEDCGEEPVEQICQEMAEYMSAPYFIIPDRGEAIFTAVRAMWEEPGVLLITGKGAETRQKRGLLYIPCPSDVEYTLAALAEYDQAHGS